MDHRYHAFISYADADREWVEQRLIPQLRQSNLRWIDQHRFAPGEIQLDELERAVSESRWTVLILSPAYFADQWSRFDSMLATYFGQSVGEWNVLPVYIAPCEPPLRLRPLVPIDLIDDEDEAWQRLIEAVSGQPQTDDFRRATYRKPRSGGLFHDVPAFPPHFLGRDQIVADLVAQLTTGGTVALSAEGLPGVGKTTLAVALAHHRTILDHFTDGVLWAGLGTQPDLLGILAGWGDALGVDVTDRPTTEDRAKAVRNAIGQHRLLLVIDDAWTADAAKALRLGGPGCAHLLTTRDQAIARSFGTVQSVEVLDPAPARQLLAELAPITAQADSTLVNRLLEAVGHLPKAIELIGGYLTEDEPVAFAAQARMALERLIDPATRPASVTDRLNATIALSLDGATQADPAARATFHALGAFAPKPARFDLAAAQAVTQAEPATLARLIQRNLLDIGQDESLALHQTLADFARTGLPDEAVARHREYFLDLVDQDRENWRNIEAIYRQVHWAWQRLSDIVPQHIDLPQFVWKVGVYQERRGLWQDKIDWAKAAIPTIQTTKDLESELVLLVNLGYAYSALGEKKKALGYYEEALSIFRQGGDKSGEATTLNNIGLVYSDLGETQKALRYFEGALPLFRQVRDRSGEATTLNNLGEVYDDLKRRQTALTYFELALPLFRQEKNMEGEATSLANIATVNYDLGEMQVALTYYELALTLIRKLGDKDRETITLNNIGFIDFRQGHLDKAADVLIQIIAVAKQTGKVGNEALYHFNLAIILNQLNRKALAIDHIEQSIALLERFNLSQDTGNATLDQRKSFLAQLRDQL